MTTRRLRLALSVAVMVTGAPVYAYRPFDGTDAAVSETGELELELGPVQGEHEAGRTTYTPAAVIDAGIAHNFELVVDIDSVFLGASVVADRFPGVGPVTVHVTVQGSYGRYRDLGGVASVIVEGPEAWKVRPVAEVLAGDVDGETTYSVLGGAIWQANDDVAIDVALRIEREERRAGGELRAGLTWSFKP